MLLSVPGFFGTLTSSTELPAGCVGARYYCEYIQLLCIESKPDSEAHAYSNNDDLASFETTLPPVAEGSGSSSLYTFSYRFATTPLRVASVCRDIHAALTGPKTRQSREIDEDKLHDAWETLDQCWKDFDGLRHLGTDGFVQAEDVERFVDGWQVRIFGLALRLAPTHLRMVDIHL